MRSPAQARRGGRPVTLWGLVFTVLATVALLGVPSAATGAGAAPRYPVGNELTGLAAETTAPTSMPPGVDVAGCRPTARHPYPVILLPGTFYTVAGSWQALGPVLADHGYCVYGLNYGQTFQTALTGGRESSIGPIQHSARQLARFVQRVRAETGASRVDIVGWSQGGMMPRWYMEKDGGARDVHELVGLAPSNHGTTLDGFFALLNAGPPLGLPATTSVAGCVACTQQEAGSAFLRRLNAPGDGVPGVKLVVIETDHDEVVTPYTSAFLHAPGGTNITLQQQCPTDGTEHLGIPYDAVALQDVLHALGRDAPAFHPRCHLSLPLLGTP
jgi:pimeloyl-ACP methyl ester carboxylesterase